MSSPEATTFTQHFKRLKDIATSLQSAQDPDVEQLLADVKLATESHAFCKARIESATTELDRMLNPADAV
jgi:hypothetical protein